MKFSAIILISFATATVHADIDKKEGGNNICNSSNLSKLVCFTK